MHNIYVIVVAVFLISIDSVCSEECTAVDLINYSLMHVCVCVDGKSLHNGQCVSAHAI